MLPTKKTTPSTDPMSYSILIYGTTKSGKSTFASKADNALFLATEPGLNALSVFKVDCHDWESILTACGDLLYKDHEFKTVVIDTIDNAYDMCLKHVCAGLDVAHPADLGYGKGWSAVNNEFKRVLTRLAALPYGLICISHSKVQEIETRTGKYDRIVPTTGASKIVLGLMDIVLMVDVEATKDEDGTLAYTRTMHTRPTPQYDAGSRVDGLPAEIPLDYQAFTEAFHAATNPTKGETK